MFGVINYTMKYKKKKKQIITIIETPVTAAPSSIPTPAKSIVTTAPSTQGPPISASSNIPPLRHRSIKSERSKVPPPVPPRGSPRAGGSHKSGISPRGTPPSSGSLNYLNDKYFDFIRPNSNNLCKIPTQNLHPARSRSVTPQPIFGKRRSPTCVQDWLEVNDFNASDYDEQILELKSTQPVQNITFKAKKPLPIKMAILQRENSFKSLTRSNNSSVRSIVQTFSKQNDAKLQAENWGKNFKHGPIQHLNNNVVRNRVNQYANPSNLRYTINAAANTLFMEETNTLKGNISKLKKNFETSPKQLNTIDNWSAKQKLRPQERNTVDKNNNANSMLCIRKYITKDNNLEKNPCLAKAASFGTSDSIFCNLKPVRAEPFSYITNQYDQNRNIIQEKQKILQTMSTIDVSNDPNKYADSFSLDGEFV